MKTIRCTLLFSLLVLLGLASLAYAGSLPSVKVKVSSSSGKTVFAGKTDPSGNFATGKLGPGSYVVQFNGNLKGGPYSLQVHAGKEEEGADSLPASKFGKGGLAIKINIAEAMSVTGKIAPAGALKTASTQAPAKNANGLKTKTENGREFVFIPPEQGGWLPGKWVPADSVEGRNAEAEHAAKSGR